MSTRENIRLIARASSCHSTENCLYLHDSYISKFEIMNYLFDNLLVAWLYMHFIWMMLYARVWMTFNN